MSDTTDSTVVTYPENLLAVAQQLINEGRFGVAVVVAHMACEVAADRALARGFHSRSISDLEEPVTDLLNGSNLANDKNRKLYVALTGDDIQNQSFWSDFKASAARRNKIIHESLIVEKSEAEHTLQTATRVVSHLKQ